EHNGRSRGCDEWRRDGGRDTGANPRLEAAERRLQDPVVSARVDGTTAAEFLRVLHECEHLRGAATVTDVTEPDRGRVRVGVRRAGQLPLAEHRGVRLTGSEVRVDDVAFGLDNHHREV